jgi:hypothetical protein
MPVTCNTFQRDASRPGTAYGLVIENGPGAGNPDLVLDDFANPGAVLKDLFEDQGVGGAGFFAIDNQSGNPLAYLTFDGYNSQYNIWSNGVTFPPGVGYVDTKLNPDPALQPCRLDGFPATGIQLRPTSSLTITPTVFNNTAVSNIPNPCSGNTVIHYQVPKACHAVTLLIRRGVDGKQVGQSTLPIYEADYVLDLRSYAPGVYFYTLLVDELPHSTKRMLVQ